VAIKALLAIKTYVKNMGDFSGTRERVSDFYMHSNENIFDLRIFTLGTVYMERITIVNRASLCGLLYEAVSTYTESNGKVVSEH
jgi:hypothetical protein